jgi:lysophospholipid acyltransferase (LPLAT)-like uncharacterized protein
MIPLPFSRVDIEIEPFFFVPRDAEPEEDEARRVELGQILRRGL